MDWLRNRSISGRHSSVYTRIPLLDGGFEQFRFLGFNKAANPDVVGTLKAAIDKINGLAMPPEFMSTAVAGNCSSPLSQHDRLHEGMHWRRLTP